MARAPIANVTPFNLNLLSLSRLQAGAFVRALLGHENSQPQTGILPPVRDTARLHAMALRRPYFVVEALVALLGRDESCNATFAALLCGRLDCFSVQT